jgi:hypothetical protein
MPAEETGDGVNLNILSLRLRSQLRSVQLKRKANIWYPRKPKMDDGSQSTHSDMMGRKSRIPKKRLQVRHRIDLSAPNGKPSVRGPAYTAGARATKHDSLLPSSGIIPVAKVQNMVAFPCE